MTIIVIVYIPCILDAAPHIPRNSGTPSTSPSYASLGKVGRSLGEEVMTCCLCPNTTTLKACFSKQAGDKA